MPREPALLTSAGRMPERSQHRASEGMDAVASVRRRGVGTPEPRQLAKTASRGHVLAAGGF